MKKRILIVAPYNSGTIAMCSRNIFLALKARAEVEVKCIVVHKFKENALDEFEDCEFCVTKEAHPILKWMNLLKQVKWLKKVKKSFRPDITISTLGNCSTINVLAGGADKKVGIFHSPFWQEKSKGKLVYWSTLFSYRYVYPRLDRLACVSSEVKRSIVDNFKFFERKDVRIVYNIHNFEDIFTKSKVRLSEEEVDYVNNNTILYIGRFDKNKAPERALYAFKEALSLLPTNANLSFIGKDQENIQPMLEKYVLENGIYERVHFLGFQSNPYKFLSRAKCLVSCSSSEGLPGVMIESLLLGKPIVTTNSSEGIWEIMSCHNDYTLNMSNNYITDDGIITPNNSDENVIINLQDAFVKIFSENFYPRFMFKFQINKEKIIEDLVEI